MQELISIPIGTPFAPWIVGGETNFKAIFDKKGVTHSDALFSYRCAMAKRPAISVGKSIPFLFPMADEPRLVDSKRPASVSRTPLTGSTNGRTSELLHGVRVGISVTPAITAQRRKRGPSLSRRTGQSGSVTTKSECKRGICRHATCPQYGRFYIDRPGQERERVSIPLGCVTKSAAIKALREHIQSLGINSAESFERTHNNVMQRTFKQQSRIWLDGIADGSIVAKTTREPMKRATISSYEGIVGFLNDAEKGGIADMALADFSNDAARKLVIRMKSLTPKLSVKTINSYFQVLQLVMASATDSEGNRLFDRKWNLSFIALPKLNPAKQATPSFEVSQIQTIVGKAKGQYAVLYSLLAGAGLRIGEALGLRVEHLLNDCATVSVVQSIWHGKLQSPKTQAAIRKVDLSPDLSRMLREYLGDRTAGFLFQTRNGLPLNSRNIERDSLDKILVEMGIKEKRRLFHSFRRFRESVLLRSETRNILINYWMGHSDEDMSTRYGKQLIEDDAWRMEWAERAGHGFKLPESLIGQLRQPETEENVFAIAS
jgi:integrase